jgi:hypothetical protein
MAVYKIFPTQDTTIYSYYPDKNTGLDEILDISTSLNLDLDPSPQANRVLIQFSSNEIIDTIDNKISGSQWQSNLRCFIADISGLIQDTTIEVYPISQSWVMGTGRFAYIPEVTNGASWNFKDYENGTLWTDGNFNPNTTGSYTSSVTIGGGTWYITPTGSQTFGFYDDKDLNINVTNIVNDWYSGSYNNDGFIIKQKDEFINNINNQPKITYYSIDTHTIYPPCLEFKWDDCIINTGSSGIVTIDTQPFTISLNENPGTFYPDSVNKFRVYSTPEYPTRVWATSSFYTKNYYLPEESYYAIQDLYTNEYVIDFDTTYTKLSQDAVSSYFKLYMNGLEPERYYKVVIKTIYDGQTIIVDNNYYFKVING